MSKFVPPAKTQLQRKRENLAEAQSHFPLKYKIKQDLRKAEPAYVVKWMREHDFTNWKRKGLNADYFTKDHRTLYFKDNIKLAYFIIAFDA